MFAVIKLKGDERKEAERRDQEARVWISGLEAIDRKIGLRAVYDLSATPFFLRGSGYPEGRLFPWVVSDFSLVERRRNGRSGSDNGGLRSSSHDRLNRRTKVEGGRLQGSLRHGPLHQRHGQPSCESDERYRGGPENPLSESVLSASFALRDLLER